jgi:hypothetical protein
VVPALVGLATAAGWTTFWIIDGPGPPLPAAFSTSPWAQRHFDDQAWLFDVAFDPTSIPRIADVRSETINVRNGRRVSWTAPPCACRRVSVWFFGGSTTFGLGQRDLHTIPSELARMAWEDGFAVDARNYGVPSEMLWREANTFAWELEHQKAPDVVVFYDGANEFDLSLRANVNGCLSRSGPPVDPSLDRLRERDAARFGAGGEDPDAGPGGARVLKSCDGVQRDVEDVVDFAAEHYRRSKHLSRIFAEAHHVDAHWFWQPSLFTRPWVAGEPRPPVADDEWSTKWWSLVRTRLPGDVVDLSDSLDRVLTPVFYDNVHHNEAASQIIARAIYRHLRPAIARASGMHP